MTVPEVQKLMDNKVKATLEKEGTLNKVDCTATEDNFFDNIPENFGNVAIANIPGAPGKQITISTPGKPAVTIEANENLMIHESVSPKTPYSRMRKQLPVVKTPDKESTETTASGKNKALTTKEQCQLLYLYIEKAKDPLQVVRQNPMKVYCKEIWDHCFIEGGPIKGRMKHEAYSELLGKKGKGFNSKICKKEGLSKYISWGIKEFMPEKERPTKDELRSIRKQILDQAMKDAKVEEPLWTEDLIKKNLLEED